MHASKLETFVCCVLYCIVLCICIYVQMYLKTYLYCFPVVSWSTTTRWQEPGNRGRLIYFDINLKMNTLVDKAKLSCAYDDPSSKVRQTASCKDTKADCGASKEDDIQVTAEHYDHDHLDHYHLDHDQNRNEFDHHHPGPHDQLTKSTSRSSDPLEGLGGGTSLPRRASVRDQSPGVGSHIALMYFSVLWMRQRARVGFDKDSTLTMMRCVVTGLMTILFKSPGLREQGSSPEQMDSGFANSRFCNHDIIVILIMASTFLNRHQFSYHGTIFSL